METELDNRVVVQNDKGYIKLLKNTKNYNWEIKAFEDMNDKSMKELVNKISIINNELMKIYGNESS